MEEVLGHKSQCSVREQAGEAAAAACIKASWDTELQLRAELAELQQQHELKCQEVQQLQAQAQRLSNFLDSNAATAAAGAETASAHIQQRLAAAEQELHERRHLEAQLRVAGAAAWRRAGALKLLLAAKLQELSAAEDQLQEAGRRQAAAQQQAADRAEDYEALKAALAAANAHILQLTAQRHSAAPHAEEVQQGTHCTAPSEPLEQPLCEEVRELRRQLRSRSRKAEAAQQALAELAKQLALSRDCAAFADRRAAVLEQQLDTAKQHADAPVAASARPRAAAAAAEAAATTAQQQRHSCSSIQGHEDCLHAPKRQQQQQQHDAGLPRASSGGLASSIATALSSATARLTHAPCVPAVPDQQGRPLSPFANGIAAARNFVAAREADLIARLKEELRDAEARAAGLAAANSRLDAQLHGLQALLTAKAAQVSRLDREAKAAVRQLKQAEAAAADDQQALSRQLGSLSEQVVQLQEQVEAGRRREQQLQLQLGEARGKLAQVLAALVEDAAALQQHAPAHYRSLAQDMPAALADAQAAAESGSSSGSSGSGSGGLDAGMFAPAAVVSSACSGSGAALQLRAGALRGSTGSATSLAAAPSCGGDSTVCGQGGCQQQLPAAASKGDMLRKLLGGGGSTSLRSLGSSAAAPAAAPAASGPLSGSLALAGGGSCAGDALAAGSGGGGLACRDAGSAGQGGGGAGRQNAATKLLDVLGLGKKASREVDEGHADAGSGLHAPLMASGGAALSLRTALQGRRTHTRSGEWAFELLEDGPEGAEGRRS